MKCQVVFICALFFFAKFHTGNSAKAVIYDVPPDIVNNIFIYLIKGPTITDNVKLSLEDGLTFQNYDFFISKRETVFYMHDWGENVYSESAVTIANAFIKRNTTNLAIFDYSVLVKADLTVEYIDAYFNVSFIGSAIGQYLEQYIPAVQSIDKPHLIGLGVGAQIMAKTARKYGAGELPWLTGLDPAGPLFNIPTTEHLQASDGIFVDVIHTDGKFYGYDNTTGTVDFFPNRGTRDQPGCENDIGMCSHQMSWRFYAVSITNPTIFKSKKCKPELCKINLFMCICSKITTYMGYNVDKSAFREYFLMTSPTWPYGEGDNGLEFGHDQ